MRRLEEGLEQLDAQDRRQVRVLVARLAAQWIGEQGPSHRTLVGEVATNGSMLRIDVFTDPPADDPALWEELAVPLARRLGADALGTRPSPFLRRLVRAALSAPEPRESRRARIMLGTT